MTIHLAWMRVTAAAATIATFGGQFAAGQSQYGPYATAPQYSTVAPYGVQPYQPTQPTVYPVTTQSPTPPTNYRTADRPEYALTPHAAYATTQQPAYAPTAPAPQSQPQYQSQYQAPQYQPPQYQPPVARPTYPSFAKQPTSTVTPGTAAPQPAESLPTPDPAMSGDPAAAGYNASSPYPSTDATGGYFASDPGRNLGAGSYQDCGVDGYMEDCDDGSQWFGGIYGLYMTRSQPGYRRYTVGVDPPTNPYFPAASDTENESDCNFLIPDWREGIEVRLGCTFGIGDSCDYGDCDSSCGGCEPSCNPCCQQMYAWEVAYWGIDREVQEQFVDGPVVGTFRYYGMINYAGLQYDDGGGAQPVNDFYNYQIPIVGPGAETVLAQRVRTNFWAQNLELNFLRLPLYTGGCGYDDCCAPAFTLTGLCGVRYFRMDDDFEFGTEWDDGSGPFNGFDHDSANELYHDIQMENNLVGFQLGANMNYCVASRWNVFWDTNFGLYNNYITHDQRLYNGLGLPVTFEQDGREATVNSDKNDVAFLGEMRLGAGYLFTANWRGTLAYRAIGISGVALAPDQIKPEYSNWADTARINADGSIIIHGVQAGIECNF